MKTELPIAGAALTGAAAPMNQAVFKDKVGWLQAWEQALWQERYSANAGVTDGKESAQPGAERPGGQASQNRCAARETDVAGPSNGESGPQAAGPQLNETEVISIIADGGRNDTTLIGLGVVVPGPAAGAADDPDIAPANASGQRLPVAVGDIESLRIIDGELGLKIFACGPGWSGADLLRAIRPRLASLGMRLAKLVVNGRVLWDAQRVAESSAAARDDDSVINRTI